MSRRARLALLRISQSLRSLTLAQRRPINNPSDCVGTYDLRAHPRIAAGTHKMGLGATQMPGNTIIPSRNAPGEAAVGTEANGRLGAQLAIALIVCALTAFCSCSRDPITRVKLRLDDQPGEKMAPSLISGSVPHCPPAGSPILQPSASTGHHSVILSWNASAPSSRPEDNAVGYCLYRSATKNAAKQNPVCGGCEQINVAPVAATGCVDDLVQDGASYYYVVTAINERGVLSSSSNEISVPIPSSRKASPSEIVGKYPSCRAPAP